MTFEKDLNRDLYKSSIKKTTGLVSKTNLQKKIFVLLFQRLHNQTRRIGVCRPFNLQGGDQL